MIVLHAVIPLDAQHREEALDMIEDLAEQSRAEDGILEYRPTTDLEDPNVVRFFERYEDEDALEAHLETDHYREFAKALPEWLAGESEAVRYYVSEVRELDL